MASKKKAPKAKVEGKKLPPWLDKSKGKAKKGK